MPLTKLKNFFTECADAIREKAGTTEKMKPDQMAFNISSIYTEPPYPQGEYFGVTSGNECLGYTFYGMLPAGRFKQDMKVNYIFLVEDITEIPDNFCYYAKNLGVLVYNGQITKLGKSAFASSTITKFVSNKDGDNNNIPAGVTEIPDNCFQYCTGLTDLNLHDNITTIGMYAFGLSAVGLTIKNTELPASLETVGNGAFSNQQIPFTKIPKNVKTINANAFSSNYALTTLTFEGTPTSIGTAFQNCNNLTTINVPWAEGAVSGAPWGATNATINYNYTT